MKISDKNTYENAEFTNPRELSFAAIATQLALTCFTYALKGGCKLSL